MQQEGKQVAEIKALGVSLFLLIDRGVLIVIQLRRGRLDSQSGAIVSSAGDRAIAICRPSARYLATVLALLVSTAIAGCNSSQAPEAEPEELRIGVLPGEGLATLKRRFSPLVHYLQQELEIPCRLVLHDSYDDLQRAFGRDELELVWFGGYTFVNANRSHGAIPLVSRDVDLRFTSYFLTRADETTSELADFRGKRFAFGSHLSTSGHLMPRHFLQTWQIDADTFFSLVRYTGSHEMTALAVRDGEVDLGVASSVTIDSMITSGRLSLEDVRILKESPPYVDYVWACQAHLPVDLRTRLRDALLNLTMANPAHGDILRQLNGKYFVPIDSDHFRDLTRLIDSLGSAQAIE